MKYNGIELVEMTPAKWDGKRKFMLVWNHREETIQQREIVEWYKNEYGYVIWRDVYNTYWNYCAEIPKDEHVCAEIPKDEPAEDLNAHIERLKAENEELKNKVNELKNSSSYQTYCDMCNVIAKHEDKIAMLEAENKDHREKIRILEADRHEMANYISAAVLKELTYRAKDIEGPVNTTMVGFGFYDISDIVWDKIFNYRNEEPISKIHLDNRPYISNNMDKDEIVKKFEKLRSELIQWLSKNDVGNLLVNNLQYGIGTAFNLSKSKRHFADVVSLSKLIEQKPEKKLAEKSPEKKYRRMTHRELAIWCAKGNGEWTNAGMRTAYQHYDYDIDRESEAVSEHIKIRACDETEWREPLVENNYTKY